MTSQFGQRMLPAPADKRNIDMTAFDNLLPGSSQGKVPMKQMAPQTANQNAGFGQIRPQQSMIGGQRMMGNMASMVQSTPMASQGMMGNQAMMGQSNFSQTLQPHNVQNGNAKKLSNQDLADFLG